MYAVAEGKFVKVAYLTMCYQTCPQMWHTKAELLLLSTSILGTQQDTGSMSPCCVTAVAVPCVCVRQSMHLRSHQLDIQKELGCSDSPICSPMGLSYVRHCLGQKEVLPIPSQVHDVKKEEK